MNAGTSIAASREGSADASWGELMARAQHGDRAAYRDLLEEIAPVIAAYCHRVFGDRAVAEDCVQEALLVLHRVRHTYEPSRPFRPWLFTLVRHSAIDLLRRQRRIRDHEVADEARLIATPAPAASADVPVPEVIGKLAAKYRDPLVLTKIDGHSTRDAARRLGISEIALRTRVHRAIALVRRTLEREAS